MVMGRPLVVVAVALVEVVALEEELEVAGGAGGGGRVERERDVYRVPVDQRAVALDRVAFRKVDQHLQEVVTH